MLYVKRCSRVIDTRVMNRSRKQKQAKPEGQEASGAKKNSMATFRRRNKMAVNHKKNFDLTDVYSAVQDSSSFDFNEEVAVDAPPPSRQVYLSQTVMTGVDVFAKQPHGCAVWFLYSLIEQLRDISGVSIQQDVTGASSCLSNTATFMCLHSDMQFPCNLARVTCPPLG